MNILLTGATGLLGNNLARILLHAGHRVTCLLRTTSKPRPLADLQCQTVYADLNEPNSLDPDQLPDFDVLIHAAALIHLGWKRYDESRRVNVESTQRLAQLCRTRRRRMIHVSSVDTLGYSTSGIPICEDQPGAANPACSYVETKAAGERAVIGEISQGLDAVILHPGFMIGPFDWRPSSGEMLLTVARRSIPFAPAGGCTTVDVRDVVRGTIQSIERGKQGEHYILGGYNISYLELWQKMASIVGKRGPRRKLPNWIAAIAGAAGDFVSRIRQSESLVNSASVSMGQKLHYYSSEKAQRELGYQLSPLEPAIHDAWEWLEANGF